MFSICTIFDLVHKIGVCGFGAGVFIRRAIIKLHSLVITTDGQLVGSFRAKARSC